MRNVLTRWGVVAAATMAAVPMLTGTASATVQNGVCEANEFCVFRQVNYSWASDWKASDTHYENNVYPLHPEYGLEDSVSSVSNENPCWVLLWPGRDQTGVALAFAPVGNASYGWYADDLTEYDFNNVASGHSIEC